MANVLHAFTGGRVRRLQRQEPPDVVYFVNQQQDPPAP